MAIPDLPVARQLLAAQQLPGGVVVHSEGVRRVALEAARLVASTGIPLDARLVEAAALLHDIDKLTTRGNDGQHGLVAAQQLESLGYAELGPPVASHPISALLDEDRFPRGWPSVIVWLADKHVAQAFLTVDQRIDDMAARYPRHHAALEAARRPARALEQELADALALSVPALVERLGAAWERGG